MPAFGPLWAQTAAGDSVGDEARPGDAAEEGDEGQRSARKTQALDRAPPPDADHDFPESPRARLEAAEDAFDNADYDILRPILEPALEPESGFEDAELEHAARTLLGVGLYFEAQQVTDAAERSLLLDAAEEQFLELLRSDPDHELSPLIYPASVVELFEKVREENEEELAQIRAERGPSAGSEDAGEGLSTIYIQREVERRSFAVAFLPFGAGQFYNGETFQGVAFATSQVAALGLNMASYWMIESLRGGDGKYDPGPGNSADIARRWRVGQYAGLGLFAAMYAWSVVDALLDHRDGDVDIRTLDEPPPELGSAKTDDNDASFQIGLGGLGLTW